MFGNKTYKEQKKKVFESDKKRKQFFAIQDYYRKKDTPKPITPPSPRKPKKK